MGKIEKRREKDLGKKDLIRKKRDLMIIRKKIEIDGEKKLKGDGI